MYDCQSDSYTGFTVRPTTATAAFCRPAPLAADVHVRALPDQLEVLTELALSSERQGYLAERRGTGLTVFGVTLGDALALNQAFGQRATFSAEFRLGTPIRFHG